MSTKAISEPVPSPTAEESATPKNYWPISLLCHVQTIRTIEPEQNSTCHRRTPHQVTGRLSTWKVMSTVESDSTHRRWPPGRKDHGDHFCGPV